MLSVVTNYEKLCGAGHVGNARFYHLLPDNVHNISYLIHTNMQRIKTKSSLLKEGVAV